MIELKRIIRRNLPDAVIGVLSIDADNIVATVENKHFLIPKGIYNLTVNKSGTMNGQYKVLFPEMHKGMIEISGVPNRDGLFFHIGNYSIDSEGCVLVGKKAEHEDVLISSRVTYIQVYPLLLAAAENGEKIKITELVL